MSERRPLTDAVAPWQFLMTDITGPLMLTADSPEQANDL
jgi:hypothetical protein